MLNQKNTSYFKCKIFCKQKLLFEFREFLVISRKSVANCSFLAFSVFFQVKLFAKVYVNFFCSRNNNRNDKLTCRNCFYNQRIVFFITEIKREMPL